SLSSPHHPSPTVIYPLSLHDALPISGRAARAWSRDRGAPGPRMRRLRPAGRLSQDHALDERRAPRGPAHLREGGLSPGARGTSRSEEHTSELQSRENLVCRLLLEKKK